MNGYKAFYRGKVYDVLATSSAQAQELAAAHFKAKKTWEVTVVLCHVDGRQATHVPA